MVPTFALAASVLLGSVRVVLVGDSLTEGWPFADPALFASGTFVAKGIGGQTSAEVLARFDRDVVALAPAVVVILAGTNDVAENQGPMPPEATLANLEAMAIRARSAGIQVVLATLPPAADFPWRRGLCPGPKIAALNREIGAIARRSGVVLLDYHSALVDPADPALGMRRSLADDGVHPNAAGYAVMRPLLESAVLEALKGRATKP